MPQPFFLGFITFFKAIECRNWLEFKYDDLPLVSILIRSPSLLEAGANHLANITNLASLQVFKEMQVLPVCYVIMDSSVTADKGHISNLAFPCVQKDTLIIPTITVAILLPLIAGEQHYEIVT